MLKGISPSDIIHQESSRSSSVIGTGNGTEGFLARGIPNLQFDLHVILHRDHAGTEFNSDGQIMDRLKALVCELEEQTRLSDTCRRLTKKMNKNGVVLSDRVQMKAMHFIAHEIHSSKTFWDFSWAQG